MCDMLILYIVMWFDERGRERLVKRMRARSGLIGMREVEGMLVEYNGVFTLNCYRTGT